MLRASWVWLALGNLIALAGGLFVVVGLTPGLGLGVGGAITMSAAGLLFGAAGLNSATRAVRVYGDHITYTQWFRKMRIWRGEASKVDVVLVRQSGRAAFMVAVTGTPGSTPTLLTPLAGYAGAQSRRRLEEQASVIANVLVSGQ